MGIVIYLVICSLIMIVFAKFDKYIDVKTDDKDVYIVISRKENDE